MGSGVLLAALVVLWFVVLVPMVGTRGDTQGRAASCVETRSQRSAEASLSSDRFDSSVTSGSTSYPIIQGRGRWDIVGATSARKHAVSPPEWTRID